MPFSIEKIAFDSLAYAAARAIRHTVFVEEQRVDAREEYDEFDAIATHFLVTAIDTQTACATARWRFTEKGIKLERFAVLSAFRRQGVGEQLVRAVMADIATYPEAQGKTLYLHAQETAMPLYAKCGFQPVGEPFYEANIKHMKMIL